MSFWKSTGKAPLSEATNAGRCGYIYSAALHRALRERLTGRGQDDERVIERRMQSARDEISHYGEADYVVLNDRFETALNELQLSSQVSA